MTTSPLRGTPAPTQEVPEATDQVRVPLRIRLDPSTGSRPLDGAWWPQTRDLAREAADLVDHFPTDLGRVQRLLFSRPDWDDQTRDESLHVIRAGRGPVKMGSFPHDDTHVMTVVLSSRQHLRLLVVPSGADPDVAERLFDLASDASNTHTAGHLLHSVSAGQDPSQVSTWDGEGGHSS